MKKEIHKKCNLKEMLRELILELEDSINDRNKVAICRSLKMCETLETTIKDMIRKC